MRLHTCGAVREIDIHEAGHKAGVDFERLTSHGSRKQLTAFDVKLLGSSPHRPNSGHRGADGNAYAASWDEWGIFLAHLFSLDPLMLTPYYASADEFHWRTARRFVFLTRSEQHRRHKWEPMMGGSSLYGEQLCECGAANRWIRSGAKFDDVRARLNV